MKSMTLKKISPYLFLLLALAPWCFVFPGVYHFDDFITPLSDPASQNLGNFFSHLSVTLRPLTKLLFALEGTIGISTADGRRIVSLLIHLGTVLIFWRLLARVLPTLPTTLLVLLVLIFELHPIHAESILALAGRSAALSSFFSLAFLFFVHKKDSAEALTCFALAVLSRETAFLLFPFLFLLPIKSKYLLIIAIPLLIWAFSLPRHLALLHYSFSARQIWDSSFYQIAAIPIGFSLYFRPWALTLDHGEVLNTFHFTLGILFYLLIIFSIFYFRRSRPLISLILLYLLLTLLPTQSIVPKLDALTERPWALALPAIIMALALCLSSMQFYPKFKSKYLILLFCALTFYLGVATLSRATAYRSDLTLWHDAAQKTEINARPWINYGTALIGVRRYAEAKVALELAFKINPFYSDLLNKLNMIKYKILLENNR